MGKKEGVRMDYFFRYESEIPRGSGFLLFGRAHLVWLSAIAAAIFTGCVWIRRLPPQSQRRMLQLVGRFALAMEVLRIYYLLWRGYLTVYELPLHLCGLAVFLCAADTFWDWDWLQQVLYGLCLPGAVCGLLFCDWTRYPLWNFTNLHSFVIHGTLVLYPALAMACGRLRPRRGGIKKTGWFLLAITPPIWLFDQLTGANYLFIRVPSPGSPLEWMAQRLGNPGYLLGYFALVAAVECCLFLPWPSGKNRKTG